MRERLIPVELSPEELRILSAYGIVAINASSQPQFIKDIQRSNPLVASQVIECCKDILSNPKVSETLAVKMLTVSNLSKTTKMC